MVEVPVEMKTSLNFCVFDWALDHLLLQGPLTQIHTVSIGEKRQPVNHTTVSKTHTSNTSTSKPTTGTRWAVRMFLVFWFGSLALQLKLKLCKIFSQETTWGSQEVSKGVWHGEEGPVVHSVPLEEGLPALHWLSFILYLHFKTCSFIAAVPRTERRYLMHTLRVNFMSWDVSVWGMWPFKMSLIPPGHKGCSFLTASIVEHWDFYSEKNWEKEFWKKKKLLLHCILRQK